eukprot:scaffold210441_cov19-Tisochrysis_lutea.AAC.2
MPGGHMALCGKASVWMRQGKVHTIVLCMNQASRSIPMHRDVREQAGAPQLAYASMFPQHVQAVSRAPSACLPHQKLMQKV